MKKTWVNKLVGIAFSGALFSACGQNSETHTSNLNITNGTIIEESDYPEVVNLYRRVYVNGQLKGGATCTGTWVGENMILTAAHCTGEGPSSDEGEVLDLEMMVFEITDHDTMPKATRLVTRVVKAVRNKAWEQKKGFGPQDLAILMTEDRRSDERERGSIDIAKTPAIKGQQVSLIGYGYHDMGVFTKKGDDHKRIGENTIDTVANGMIEISGKLKDESGGATGLDSSAGQGDSGGPMLRDGLLIGVASGGGSGGLFPRGEASYVDLNSEISRQFLARFGL